MVVELLTFGDELLDGRRIDTNTGWLGRKFTAMGIPPRFRQTTTDRIEDIVEAFQIALKRSDFILSTGGLGPTADDLTFEALAQALGKKLAFHESIFLGIQKRFKERGIHCPDSNRRQAMLPEGAIEIGNEWGTAPGIRVEVEKKIIFCLPGVPLEMENLFQKGIEPELQKRLLPGKNRVEKIYKFVGIPESHVEEAIDRCQLDRFSDGEVRIAYTASFPQIDVTLSVTATDEKTLKNILKASEQDIHRELGKFLAAQGEDTVESRLVSLLQEKGWSVALAESFTGGMVASQIVNVPGSSTVFQWGVVTYSNDSKVKILQVSPKTVETFGAVSKECALEMARGAKKVSGCEVAISTTGIAGPSGGTESKPVGLGFIAWVGPNFEKVERYHFRWDRNRNRMLATFESLKGLIGLIENEIVLKTTNIKKEY